MTERGGIDAGERLAAPTTCRREDRNDLLTLLRRQQRTLVLFMTGLTAAFSGGLGLGRRRLVVRMSRRGRLRRIGGRGALQPSELGFKFRDTSGQTNDLFALPAKQSQHARRRRGKIGFGDLRRCIHASCKNTRSAILTLHRSVNGYGPRPSASFFLSANSPISRQVPAATAVVFGESGKRPQQPVEKGTGRMALA